MKACWLIMSCIVVVNSHGSSNPQYLNSLISDIFFMTKGPESSVPFWKLILSCRHMRLSVVWWLFTLKMTCSLSGTWILLVYCSHEHLEGRIDSFQSPRKHAVMFSCSAVTLWSPQNEFILVSVLLWVIFAWPDNSASVYTCPKHRRGNGEGTLIEHW